MSDGPMTATEVRYRMELWWKEREPDFLRIDYLHLTATFDILQRYMQPMLRWMRVRRRWESKHATH